jgi:hypothetical protein
MASKHDRVTMLAKRNVEVGERTSMQQIDAKRPTRLYALTIDVDDSVANVKFDN